MNKHLFKLFLVLFISAMVLSVSLPAAAQSPTYTTISGKIGPGALYEIAMPTGPWNRELVVFAHGIAFPNDPIDLPDLGAFRDTLTGQGFALIYSSYSINGYAAVKDGMKRTHQLRGIFASKVAQPARVYLYGQSLGGLITLMLAERYPGQYDGVVTDGGLVGGGPSETKYCADTRILFDYFFPGVIPGTAWYIPPEVVSNSDPTIVAVLDALLQGLDPALGYPTLQFAEAAKFPTNDPEEIVWTGLTVLGFDMGIINSLVELTHGIPYDNTETVYSCWTADVPCDDVALNAGVARYAADPEAANYLQHYYTPTGDLRIPVITLHATRDPMVPNDFHEPIYAAAVANAGASQYLLQRQVDEFGHTGISDADMTTAVFDLVEWVHTGVKPLN